jgi:hypothetical protein
LSQEALLFAEPVIFAPDHPPPVDEKDPFISVSAALAWEGPAKSQPTESRKAVNILNFLVN